MMAAFIIGTYFVGAVLTYGFSFGLLYRKNFRDLFGAVVESLLAASVWPLGAPYVAIRSWATAGRIGGLRWRWVPEKNVIMLLPGDHYDKLPDIQEWIYERGLRPFVTLDQIGPRRRGMVRIYGGEHALFYGFDDENDAFEFKLRFG